MHSGPAQKCVESGVFFRLAFEALIWDGHSVVLTTVRKLPSIAASRALSRKILFNRTLQFNLKSSSKMKFMLSAECKNCGLQSHYRRSWNSIAEMQMSYLKKYYKVFSGLNIATCKAEVGLELKETIMEVAAIAEDPLPAVSHEEKPVRQTREGPPVNVGDIERILSVASGLALGIYGLKQRSLAGALLAVAGGSLLYRGATGHCNGYAAAGVSTTKGHGKGVERGIKIEQSITINCAPEVLYRFWHDPENLPRIMSHIHSITPRTDTISSWTVTGPAGQDVKWDAEIINDEKNTLIAWQSLENADVRNAGSVRFLPVPGGVGTELRVSLQYMPTAGMAGAALARLFGKSPERQIREDLRRFKQIMECGEIVSTAGQPTGRCSSNC